MSRGACAAHSFSRRAEGTGAHKNRALRGLGGADSDGYLGLSASARACATKRQRACRISNGATRGTQEGQFGSHPPSGKTFRVRQIHTYGFDEQGRIANHVAVRDDIAMLQQLGHLPLG
jgi:hypothetical protein